MKMRYGKNRKPKAGDERIVKKFLYLPLRLFLKDDINGIPVYQTRWLEWVEIIQVWIYINQELGISHSWYDNRWNDNG